MSDPNLKKLAVVIDGNKLLEFDRQQRLPGIQRRALDEMDARMDQGITMSGERIEQPDALLRAQYVANILIDALLKEQDSLAAATCSYLAMRMPDLQQIRAKSSPQGVSIELVFDRSYEQSSSEQVINFVKPH